MKTTEILTELMDPNDQVTEPYAVPVAPPEQLSDFRVLMMSMDDLIADPRNARTHTPEQVAQLAASIVEFGWTNPILIRPNRLIIAGHARVLAARQLGFA